MTPSHQPKAGDHRRAARPVATSSARIDALYREFAAQLVAAVAAQLGWPRQRVEDGCQQAWAILARRPDVLDGPGTRGWLVTVAGRACLAEARRAPIPVAHLADPAALAGPAAPPLEELLEARAALRSVAALRPVRRRVFERHLAGLSYREIMAELDVSYTNVNRQITDSRTELREAA